MSASRIEALRALLRRRILVLDGAMGTAIQDADLSAADFGGDDFEGCNELLTATCPQAILDIHAAYLAAGADIIETDTFGGTPLVLAEFGVAERARELNRLAAELARRAAADFDTPDRLRFVAGSMGPTTKAISVTGGVTFEELRRHYREQALGLLEGGADYLLVETIQDTRNAKAALLGIAEAGRELGLPPTVALSGTIETMGTTLAGQTIDAFTTSILHAEPLYLGLNCATGPEQMTDHLRVLSAVSPVPVACVPNAGLPDEDGLYTEDARRMAAALERFLDEGWLDLVGGCCGSGPGHGRALCALVDGRAPRSSGKSGVPAPPDPFCLSGLENLELTDENRPILVGERTNIIGSRRFKELIRAGEFETAAEIARKQVRGGAQVIDICLADPDGDERRDTDSFLSEVIKRVKVPLMIDSTDVEVFARALTWCQGRAVLNSVNLEEGEERFAEVAPLVKRFGAALVVGCIDEDPDIGMARTRERKLEVARRSYDLLTGKYGLKPNDLIFDPLVFPCATGDEEYLGAARETIEGLRLIKNELPGVRTILGISNVSFGLPPAAREIVNSVFLYQATKAGLDLAIVNTQRLERYASLSPEAREMAERVLFVSDNEAVSAMAERYAKRKKRVPDAGRKLSPPAHLSRCVIEGSKEGLVETLDRLLGTEKPLDIINGPLMSGMAEVGRLFNANELIVAEVLQSAAVMKAAVAHLEPHLDGEDSAVRGKLVLATVKGDVHDIGKNLVEIILSNNGYRVIDLGIRVPPSKVVEAVREHEPDLLGLSGLLVKSTAQMTATAEELSRAGLTPPLLVGGAALSRKYTARRIAEAYDGVVAYAQDAMQGLDLADRLRDDTRRDEYSTEWDAYRTALKAEDAAGDAARAAAATTGATAAAGEPEPVLPAPDSPQPADFERHAEDFDLDAVWRYLNPRMVFNRHLGFKGNFEKQLAGGDERARQLRTLVDGLQKRCRDGDMVCRGVWRALEAEADGDSIVMYSAGATEPAGRFTFPRQRGKFRLCLSDFVRAEGRRENLVLFAVTAGSGIRRMAGAMNDAGELLESHAIQVLALETAEAAAEYLHARLRTEWGFADEPDVPPGDIFRAKYRGCRFSFGYPACPSLEGQRLLFDLLRPEEAGIQLTEGCMMDPEASVSGLVFHHPQAEYFSTGPAR